MIVGMAFASAASLVLRWLYVRENKKRDKEELAGKQSEVSTEPDEEKGAPKGSVDSLDGLATLLVSDRSDKKTPGFRYTL